MNDALEQEQLQANEQAVLRATTLCQSLSCSSSAGEKKKGKESQKSGFVDPTEIGFEIGKSWAEGAVLICPRSLPSKLSAKAKRRLAVSCRFSKSVMPTESAVWHQLVLLRLCDRLTVTTHDQTHCFSFHANPSTHVFGCRSVRLLLRWIKVGGFSLPVGKGKDSHFTGG